MQYIIDSVIRELAIDPQKRYIQVETAFFWRWWKEASDPMKAMVQQLVNEGRLEFIGGGWAMHDEAAVHYSSLIDNMAYGNLWILQKRMQITGGSYCKCTVLQR